MRRFQSRTQSTVFFAKRLFLILTASSLAILNGAPSAAERFYVGVFAPGDAETRFTMPSTRSEILALATQQVFDGYRLEDVESFLAPGGRRYIGIWQEAGGSVFLSGPTPTVEFRDFRDERNALGEKLADFEVSRDGGERYIGLWRGRPGAERLSGRRELDAFLSLALQLAESDGLRLVDMEISRSNGTVLYEGLFRSGQGSNEIVPLTSRQNFLAQVEELRLRDLKLVDVELVETSGEPLYAGVFQGKSGRHSLSSPRRLHSFANLVILQNAIGRRLIDVEVFDDGQIDDPFIDDEPVPSPVTALPHPEWAEFSNATRLVVDFTLDTDDGFRITFPTHFLKDLPRFAGVVALPDQLCGIKVEKPIRWTWTENGEIIGLDPIDPLFNTAEFDDPETIDVDEEAEFMRAFDDITFSAPIGPCSSDPQWFFPGPLTDSDQGFTAPERELALTIDLAQDSHLVFTDTSKPKGKPLTFDKLFKHVDFRDKIEKVMKIWKITKDEHGSGVCEIATFLSNTCIHDPGGLDCRHAGEVKEFANC